MKRVLTVLSATGLLAASTLPAIAASLDLAPTNSISVTGGVNGDNADNRFALVGDGTVWVASDCDTVSNVDLTDPDDSTPNATITMDTTQCVRGMLVSSAGVLYVSVGEGTVYTYAEPIEEPTPSQVLTSLEGNFSADTIVEDPAGNIWYHNEGDNTAIGFQPDAGGAATQVGAYDLGSLAEAIAIAFDSEGALYAVDYDNDAISVFNTGNFGPVADRTINEDTAATSPGGITVVGDTVYVTYQDSVTGVYGFPRTASGLTPATFENSGEVTLMDGPYQVSIDPCNGVLAVGDSYQSALRVYTNLEFDVECVVADDDGSLASTGFDTAAAAGSAFAVIATGAAMIIRRRRGVRA